MEHIAAGEQTQSPAVCDTTPGSRACPLGVGAGSCRNDMILQNEEHLKKKSVPAAELEPQPTALLCMCLFTVILATLPQKRILALYIVK